MEEFGLAYKKTIVTAAAAEAVSTTEAKTWMGIASSSHDTLVANLVKAATQKIETDYDCAIITQTWDIKMDDFPNACYPQNPDADINLFMYPVASITSISYLDGAGDTQTLSTDVYGLDNPTGSPAKVYLKNGQEWPEVLDQPNSVTLRLVCGYGASASNVPDPIRLAIQLMAKFYYDNPEDMYRKGSAWERSAKDLLNNYFNWRVA